MRKLDAIEAAIKQKLRDEFLAGVTEKWTREELKMHIDTALSEISEKRPYEVIEGLTTAATASYELDISTITDDLLDVEKVEFPVDESPRVFHNVKRFADVLTVIRGSTLTASASINVYCLKLHSLTRSSSTLTEDLERLLVMGVCAEALIALSTDKIGKINTGGSRTPQEFRDLGLIERARFEKALGHCVPKTERRYPL